MKQNSEKNRFHLLKKRLYQNRKAEIMPVVAGRFTIFADTKFSSLQYLKIPQVVEIEKQSKFLLRDSFVVFWGNFFGGTLLQ